MILLTKIICMKNYLFCLLILLFISGCSNEGEQLANKACSCMMEAGLKKGLNPSNFAGNFDQDNVCTDELGRELYDKLKGMNNSQRAEFMKDFARGLLETDCAEIAFNLLPYDRMMDEMEKKYNEDYTAVFKIFSKEPSICDCVQTEVDVNKDLRIWCNEMEKVWRERYENGDEKDKDEMIREIEECGRLKDAQK